MMTISSSVSFFSCLGEHPASMNKDETTVAYRMNSDMLIPYVFVRVVLLIQRYYKRLTNAYCFYIFLLLYLAS